MSGSMYYQYVGADPYFRDNGVVVPYGGVFAATPRECARIARRKSAGAYLHLRSISAEQFLALCVPTVVEPWWWERAVVYIVGGGPSAGRMNWGAVRAVPLLDRIVVAVNDSARMLLWADVVYTADLTWVRRRRDLLREVYGQVVIATPGGSSLPYHVSTTRPRRVVARRSDYNSGLEALYWVAAQGACRIVLCGFDLGRPAWWHGGYDWPNRKSTARQYATWLPQFEAAAEELAGRGIVVENANPDSAIRCFSAYKGGFCQVPAPRTADQDVNASFSLPRTTG